MPLILIVDDSLDDLLFLKEFLTNNDLDFRLASSGRMAMDLLQIENFDLVVSDFQMDDGDGLWLLTEMKKKSIHSKFILVSSDLTHSADFLKNHGAASFLPKPIHLPDLISQIQKCLAV
jgi:two-component system response regulator HydG